jgi:hypothetical protein
MLILPGQMAKLVQRPSGLYVPPNLRFLNAQERYDDIFPQPDYDQSIIWRYLDTYKYEDLIRSNTLYLRQLARFRDPEEGTLSLPAKKAYTNFLLRYNDPVGASKIDEIVDGIRNHSFATCWNLHPVEDQWMWDNFCEHHQGVAIRSTYFKVKSGIPELFNKNFIGCIKYGNRSLDMMDYGNALNLCMLKDRENFEREREVRILHHSYDIKSDFFRVPFQVDRIDAVVIHPSRSSDQVYKDRIYQLTEKYAPSLVAKIQESSLTPQ